METLHPGLYLQEVKGESPVEGVSTSTGAFVGTTIKGVIGESQLVTSWGDFVSKYGGFDVNSYLAYAVRGFFENGGSRAYISRAVKHDAGVKTSVASTVSLGADTPFASVSAKTDGTYGDKLSVSITKVDADTKRFDISVSESNVVLETFEQISLAELDDTESAHVDFVTLLEDATPVAGVHQLAGGNDGVAGITGSDYIGDSSNGTGLYAFDGQKINLVAIPGITDASVAKAVETYVDARQDCFGLLEVPFGASMSDAKDYKETEANISSPNVAVYYSWLKILDPIGVGTSPLKNVPPTGHVMGILARIDNSRGVFKAPAGIEAVVKGATGLEHTVGDAEQDILNPIGVNCIRSFPGEGIILWGARTAQPKGEFRYISARRSLLFINQSVLDSTRWAIFETNDATLWGKLKTSVEEFLRGFWKDGGLRGADEAQAFFVQVDDSTTTQAEIDLGIINAHYGVALQKPAEFVVFKVSLRK